MSYSSPNTVAAIAAILKNTYAQGDLALESVYKLHPFWNKIKKSTDAAVNGGYQHCWPVATNPNATASHTDTVALTADVAETGMAQFQMSLATDIDHAVMTTQAIETSASAGKSAFEALVTLVVDHAKGAIANRVSREIMTGKTAMGKIGSGLGLTVTLDDPYSAIRFFKGDVICFGANNDGTGSLRSASGLTVDSVDVSSGLVKFTTTVSGLSGSIQTGDGMYKIGDFGKGPVGFLDYCPTSAIDSTPFLNVDRTISPMLVGVRLTGTNATMFNSLCDGVSEVARCGGGSPDMVVLNPKNYRLLAQQMNSSGQRYQNSDKEGKVGFQGLTVLMDTGPVEVVSDRMCPVNVALIVESATWEFISLGDVPKIIQQSGIILWQTAGQDAWEIRVGYYGNLKCLAPGRNGVVSLS